MDPSNNPSAPEPTPPTPPSEPEPLPSPANPQPAPNQTFITPPVANQPIVSDLPKKSRKKRLLLIGLSILLLLLVAGYVFGYYLPNTPDNAYKTGINRTGYALDRLIKGVSEKSNLDTLKKSDITLGIEAKYGAQTYTGSLNAKFDASKANADINFTTQGKQNNTFNAKIMGELPEGSQYPNVYLQLNGLKDLGIDAFVPGAAAYDGKWIAITSDYLKSLGNVPTAEETNKKRLTSDDIAELAKAATSVTREYVFSTDPSKAIFEKQAFVGKEKEDGVNTFHYKVTLNQDHVTAYCRAMIDKIYSTSAYKKLPWVDEDNVDKTKEKDKKDCDASKATDDNSYDLWIESKLKLIYKYRITSGKEKDTYTELGQRYKGGSKFTFFANDHNGENKADGKLSLDIDFESSTTTGSLTYTGGENDNKYSIKVTLDAKPYSGEIKVDEPSNTVPVDDVLKTFGIDPKQSFGSSRSSSNTTPPTNID